MRESVGAAVDGDCSDRGSGRVQIGKDGTLMRGLAVITWLWLLTGAGGGVIDSGKMPVPMLKNRVNDTASVLSTEDQERISNLLRDYEKETKHQIAVLIVPTLGDETIESFCLRISNKWGLGRKGIDDGILVCLAMKERRVRIELGIGMNRYISNTEAKAIIDVEMTPAFSKKDIAGRLERGLKRLMEEGRRFTTEIRDQAQVFERMRAIIVRQLGVSPEVVLRMCKNAAAENPMAMAR